MIIRRNRALLSRQYLPKVVLVETFLLPYVTEALLGDAAGSSRKACKDPLSAHSRTAEVLLVTSDVVVAWDPRYLGPPIMNPDLVFHARTIYCIVGQSERTVSEESFAIIVTEHPDEAVLTR